MTLFLFAIGTVVRWVDGPVFRVGFTVDLSETVLVTSDVGQLD